MKWNAPTDLPSKKYICGYCGNKVASAKGYLTSDTQYNHHGFIYICPHCSGPSFIHDGEEVQLPGVAPGNDVEHLPEDISKLYKEARRCVSVNSHTSAVLASRKLLMNIAVSQGAEAGKSFLHYVKYLADSGFVPPNGRGWVDHIRNKGNEANHEIHLMKREDAEELIAFSEMLLKFIYEFPAKVPKADE